MIAVIEAGGKQFIVSPTAKIKTETQKGDAGAELSFDKVLLVANEDGTALNIGVPTVKAAVAGKVLRQFRTRKVMVRKFKNKTRYHRTAGHRQNQTEIEIGSIA